MDEPSSKSVEKFAWSWIGCGRGLVIGLAYGLLIGLGGGLAFGLAGVLLVGLVGGLSGTSLTKDVHLKPNQGIHTSGWNALRLGLVFGLVGVLGNWLVFGMLGALLGALGGGLIGVLLFGGRDYFQHYLLRLLLAYSRALPWRTVPFLEEARGCILLQRVGGGYRFVHPLLQEYFASLTFSLTIEK